MVKQKGTFAFHWNNSSSASSYNPIGVVRLPWRFFPGMFQFCGWISVSRNFGLCKWAYQSSNFRHRNKNANRINLAIKKGRSKFERNLYELTTTVPGLEEPQPITEDIPYNTQSYFVKITNRNPREKNYRLLRRHVYFVTHAPGWTSWQQDSMLFSPPKQKFRTNCWENVAEMSRALL